MTGENPQDSRRHTRRETLRFAKQAGIALGVGAVLGETIFPEIKSIRIVMDRSNEPHVKAENTPDPTLDREEEIGKKHNIILLTDRQYYPMTDRLLPKGPQYDRIPNTWSELPDHLKLVDTALSSYPEELKRSDPGSPYPTYLILSGFPQSYFRYERSGDPMNFSQEIHLSIAAFDDPKKALSDLGHEITHQTLLTRQITCSLNPELSYPNHSLPRVDERLFQEVWGMSPTEEHALKIPESLKRKSQIVIDSQTSKAADPTSQRFLQEFQYSLSSGRDVQQGTFRESGFVNPFIAFEFLPTAAGFLAAYGESEFKRLYRLILNSDGEVNALYGVIKNYLFFGKPPTPPNL